MRELYPIFIKLSGRTVLIAGGGKLARQKLATLEPTGADVVVAAPRIDRHGLDWRGAGRLTLLTRPYGCDLLEGCALVFAATDDPAVNRRIVADAGARGILANAVDDPEFCDFYTPAVARRAGVTIAISTAGGFPGFSGVLREILERLLPDGDGAMLEELFALRGALRHSLDPERRRKAMGELIEGVKRRYLEPHHGGSEIEADENGPDGHEGHGMTGTKYGRAGDPDVTEEGRDPAPAPESANHRNG